MTTPLINSILAKAPQQGRVERITVRPGKGKRPREIDAWPIGEPGYDYGRSKRRAVTLIQAEHLPLIAQLMGQDSPPDLLDLRRNILVSGFNLRALLDGWRFQLGDAILRGTVEADPCEQMEAALGPGAIHAMVGHGGICAAIEQPGLVRVGDPLIRLDRVK
ncbi:MAG: MOSC domain-containing protein [Myxococcota bacterium]|nr:MOSC domain-containing protein [Myxococcota bacterium]